MIVIKNGDIIKHNNFKDVYINIKKVYDYGHGVRISGVWWNLGFVNSYSLNIKVALDIAKDEKDIKNNRRTSLSEWVVLSPESFEDNCHRNSKWLKIK